jgi:hypothetical protein
MKSWPRNPIIYEINTFVWLNELSRRHNRVISLRNVPAEEWDALLSCGFDAVWLMGVWERSPAGTRIARGFQKLRDACRKALPDFRPKDVVGSPYCVHRYTVDKRLGGSKGLAVAREVLARQGMKLILDFVPNHTAIDHPWISKHPEYFIQGIRKDLEEFHDAFFESGGKVFARGRDPFFPPWEDTAQVNAFSSGLRRAYVDTLLDIAKQCDGVRCDMAMLFTGNVFEGTWGTRVGERPPVEFWEEMIAALRKASSDFLFMAEVYWDLEPELQKQGFDYCYDKTLYDLLVSGNAGSIRRHLHTDPAYQGRLVRFIENHDEPRAAETFSPAKLRAAAVAFATLPGAKILHDGQLEGRKIKLPVQLGRRPAEECDEKLHSFYRRLLGDIRTLALRDGDWCLCALSGWPDNASFQNLLAWCWRWDKERRLIVINYSDARSQGRVRLPWKDLDNRIWQLKDLFSDAIYERDGKEMIEPGLFVDLEPRGFHYLVF